MGAISILAMSGCNCDQILEVMVTSVRRLQGQSRIRAAGAADVPAVAKIVEDAYRDCIPVWAAHPDLCSTTIRCASPKASCGF